MAKKQDIRALTKEQLRNFFMESGDKAFRGNQVYEWLWSKVAYSFDDMTNLSKETRKMLDEHFVINHIEVDQMQRSNDGTIKNAIKLHDSLIVESVLIPTETRTTACVSSQVGCSLDCNFCATARLKRMRNLNPDEIYDQVVAIDKQSRLYHNPKMIKKLADDEVKFNLAVSLHSAIDAVRSKMMPINEKSDLAELLESLQYWYTKTKKIITFEYVIWKGINDTQKDVNALVGYCKQVPSKVNLIEYNAIDDGEFQQASVEATDMYVNTLESNRIVVNVRRSRGKDIDAACGQLANKTS